MANPGRLRVISNGMIDPRDVSKYNYIIVRPKAGASSAGLTLSFPHFSDCGKMSLHQSVQHRTGLLTQHF